MFRPKLVYFEKGALKYSHGEEIYNKLRELNIPIEMISNKLPLERTNNRSEKYLTQKEILVVGVKRISKLQSCKPSAHYQLPLVSGCPGLCEYCYLNTRFYDRAYTKVYANVYEILEDTKKYTKENETIIFEGAASSDPVPIEPYTNNLKKAIEFFGASNNTKFRFVTKFTDIDSLLNIKHNYNTTIRFSINADKVINDYEKKVPSLIKRIEAAKKIYDAGYPLGFIVGPIVLFDDYKKEYKDLMNKISDIFGNNKEEISFEFISHRYTTTAKNKILELFENTTLPMNDEEREYKYGQFGYGKYVYPKEKIENIKTFFMNELETSKINYRIEYMI